LKRTLSEVSEKSAKLNRTPGKYQKETIQVSEDGENLKSRKQIFAFRKWRGVDIVHVVIHSNVQSLLENRTGFQVVRNSPHLMEFKVLLLRSKLTETCLYTE
jgi:hypothetical protein